MTNLERNPLIGMAITIDGTAASGKGTLATKLSERYKMKFLDTGTLYRAAVLASLRAGVDLEDSAVVAKVARAMSFDFKHTGNNKFATFLDGENVEADIRAPKVDHWTPRIAVQNLVRAALLDRQIDFAKEWKPVYGVILDGRDCGARIAPDAEVKFFITGDAKIRAERRQSQLAERGIDVSLDELHADMVMRDERDAPNTIKTDDAHVLDCTKLNAEEVFAAAVEIVSAQVSAQGKK